MKGLEVSRHSSSSSASAPCGLMEEKRCVGWAMKYFQDCLCNLRDEISFVLGIASLLCWAVAEIPQIITNFKNKSADGVSLAFVSTWIAGDAFNLIGCILEPATLPTQYYTALLYTATTIVLALQCLYYDHFLRFWRRRQSQQNEVTDERRALTRRINDGIRRDASRSNDPVEVPHRKDFHFISARSLAGSDDPLALDHHSDQSSSSDDDEATTIIPAASDHQYPKPLSQPRPIPRRPIGYGTFVAAAAYLPRATKGSQLRLMGRRSLQEQEVHGSSKYGQWFGWLMAAIYMGGRLPQIWLNIKRGSVEGLNPLMFIFALIANATYVGSILVRSTEWEKIKANIPWLLDALVCVALDTFIIIQYIFYRFIKRNQRRQTFGKYYEGYLEPDCYKPRSSY